MGIFTSFYCSKIVHPGANDPTLVKCELRCRACANVVAPAIPTVRKMVEDTRASVECIEALMSAMGGKLDVANGLICRQAGSMHFDSIPPLSLLAGSHLTGVKAGEHDWVFEFSGGVSIVAESHWRLVDGDRVILTDGDHEQMFGLKEPVDAAGVVKTELHDAEVSGVEFSSVSDLLLSFTNGRSLQVLVGSAGYENWHVYGADAHTFARGGGEICRFAR